MNKSNSKYKRLNSNRLQHVDMPDLPSFARLLKSGISNNSNANNLGIRDDGKLRKGLAFFKDQHPLYQVENESQKRKETLNGK